jgi:hypothetical protein
MLAQMEPQRASYLQILSLSKTSRKKLLQMIKFFVLYLLQALVLFPMVAIMTHLLSLHSLRSQ